MRVRFWGTRGSIPRPGPSTLRYGGNTSCVELSTASGTTVILDCGTGALALGAEMMRRGKPLRGNLLISHTHWDHIQGLPFFVPLFVPGNEWDIYAPNGFLQSVREVLAGQMQHTYFPVDLAQLGATIRYHDLTEGVFHIDDIAVRTRYLNHPALTLGYRLEADGAVLAYCCDHEPHSRPLASGSGEIGAQDRAHIDFVAGADLLIHDAQYRAVEYESKVGWGHSTLEYVAAVAKAGRVKKLALTHHDPQRDDDTLDREVAELRAQLRGEGATLEVLAAAEGLAIEVQPTAATHRGRPAGEGRAAELVAPLEMRDRTVLLGMADRHLYDEFRHALRADGVRVVHAADRAAAVGLARRENPSLIVLDRHLPGDGLETSRDVRGSGAPIAADVPIIVTGNREEIAAGNAAGVTDWLIKPFSEIYARARMRAWLMRIACRWKHAPLPDNEDARLAALHGLAVLDTAPEERFDRLTRLATAMFDVPVALVSLIDADRQWFKSACGAPVGETPRDVSFCAHAILKSEAMVVPDALLDARFADNPVVVDPPRVRFYAGCPLILDDGICVGTLCLIDIRPRQFDEASIALLKDLAALVVRELQHPAAH